MQRTLPGRLPPPSVWTNRKFQSFRLIKAQLCNLGINVEEFCPATCGLCNGPPPAEHFWGRLRTYDSYIHYAQVQDRAMRSKVALRDAHWVTKDDIDFLAEYLHGALQFMTYKGLCHGTRQGKEQQWFMEALPGFEVWGTEISETGQKFPNTFHIDFHEAPPEWKGLADFVYSNALDHSYDPPRAIRAWMSAVAMDGALIIEYPYRPSAALWQSMPLSDPYQASMAQLQRLVLTAGAFEICDVLRRADKAWLVVSHEGRGPCRALTARL